MTTNQTIDGVPRELLVRLCNFHAAGWEDIEPEIKELRALLDAKPAEVTGDDALALTVDHQQFIAGDHEDLIDNASDFQDRAYALGIARGAARGAKQPRGMPFGYWLSPCNLPEHGVFHRASEDTAIVDGLSSVGGFDVVVLYDEQPAPVAVVMPDRKDPGEYRDASYTQTCMSGEWNACLDEVTRLTATVRIPERLNHSDGLHTYEYVTGHNDCLDKALGVKS